MSAVAGVTALKMAATGEPQKTAEAMAKRLVVGLPTPLAQFWTA